MQIQYVCDKLFFLNLQKGKYPVKKRYFTLVELLVVVGIVVILAGLVLPAVIGGAQQGRITQAKSDMKAIQMALAQMDQTYGRILKVESGKVKFATKSGDTEVDEKDNNSSTIPTKYVKIDTDDAYDSLIGELTANARFKDGSTITYKYNPRKIKFLETDSNFDAALDYNEGANQTNLWRDPWGKRYIVMINTDGNDRIVRPDDNTKYIMGKTAIYSYGPNGENDNGKNAAEGGDKLQDDIATWHK